MGATLSLLLHTVIDMGAFSYDVGFNTLARTLGKSANMLLRESNVSN